LVPFHNLRASGGRLEKRPPMPLSIAMISDLFYKLFLGHNTRRG
jgi:hypothetical protein